MDRVKLAIIALCLFAAYALVSTMDYREQRAAECERAGWEYSAKLDLCVPEGFVK